MNSKVNSKVNSKTLIELAREAGWEYADDDRGFEPLWHFAELVRADERGKFCTMLRQLHDSYSLASDSNTIRARGNI
jgi:hypothetical protein